MRRALIATIACLLAFPCVAGAVTYTVIPPQNSGANQYVESVPTATGGRSTLGVASASGSASPAAAPIPVATNRQLARHGRIGRRVATLVAVTAPARHRDVSGGTAPTGGSGGSGGSGGGQSSVLTLMRAVVGDGSQGGMGAALPLLMVLTAVGAVVVAVRKRRAG